MYCLSTVPQAHFLSSTYIAFESIKQLLVTYINSGAYTLDAQWLYASGLEQ